MGSALDRLKLLPTEMSHMISAAHDGVARLAAAALSARNSQAGHLPSTTRAETEARKDKNASPTLSDGFPPVWPIAAGRPDQPAAVSPPEHGSQAGSEQVFSLSQRQVRAGGFQPVPRSWHLSYAALDG